MGDGKYYGGQIVESGRRYAYDDAYIPTYGSRYADGYRSGSVVRYGSDVGYGGRYGGYYGSGYAGGYGSSYATDAYPLSDYRRTVYGGDYYDGYYGSRYADRYAEPLYDGYSRYGSYSSAYPASRVVRATPSRSSSALALDAADGVIDGKFHGARIVDRTAGYSGYASSYPSSYAADYPSYSGYGSGYYGGSRVLRGASAAERLDAADGVIDGKCFGSRIVERSPYRRY
eukprot:NODE_1520_length_950_cov_1008.118757_g1057_i0.p1 GENE.NODE_1520_length_950_cov_1008.118757_g1057_i0~~NODE_1520_length_950_cov_1008.118757_g1057_i0.p1  ORF type:complete len:238 (+),score=104.00 NODE_1520_length_950_cov_1008.118757_g1057_i0:28-714(+)